MYVTLISIVAANLITFYIAWDGSVVRSIMLVKWGIIAIILSVIGVMQEQKKKDVQVKLYFLGAILLTLYSFSKL